MAVSLEVYSPLAKITSSNSSASYGILWSKEVTKSGGGTWNRVKDTMAPSTAITQPADGSTVNDMRPQIAVSYQDQTGGTGVDVSSLHITMDGTDITAGLTVGASGAQGTSPLALSSGSHTLQVTIKDYEGNQAQTQSAFTVW